MVDDQAKALQFYTAKLGFLKKNDIPMGDYRWLTVVSPEAPEGTELLLEPNAHRAAKPFQSALYADGIPATMFAVDDAQKEYDRLVALGVTFRMAPARMGPVTIAVLDDTCGNWIQFVQMHSPNE